MTNDPCPLCSDEMRELIEKLEVCGTCVAWMDFGCGRESKFKMELSEATDRCHFTPSRWTPYWEAKP